MVATQRACANLKCWPINNNGIYCRHTAGTSGDENALPPRKLLFAELCAAHMTQEKSPLCANFEHLL